ncbi:MAG: helix-turn-helix domain-containing protein [Clostridia bacterium]|nr:helix-turn-helix domain-containing protein [Clostridia bacterium]
MKKYNNKANVLGMLLKEHREKLGLSKEEVCRQVQLHGVYIHRVELYRMELGQSIIKDFELIALCEVLKIDYNTEVKKLID